MTMTETRPWNQPKAKAGKPEAKGPTTADRIDQLYALREQIATLKKQEESIAATLKDMLGHGSHKGNKVIMVVSTVDGERFDTKSFKADHPEFAGKYTVATSTTRTTFKPLV